MRIAVVGWGSLVWDPRTLPLEGDWQCDGPVLPLEFSRVSGDARLTLVIDPQNGRSLRSLYAVSSRKYLEDAVADLRDRERTLISRIGRFEKGKSDFGNEAEAAVGRWLSDRKFDAAIWTALKSNYEDELGQPFSIEGAADYLQSLPCSARKNAMEYIRKAPAQISTPLRIMLREKRLI